MIWFHRFRWTVVTACGLIYALVAPQLFYRRRK